MKMMVWKAPAFLAPILRRLFNKKSTNQKSKK